MMKRALVTGGSGAIGAAICERLAADGLEVLVHANSGIARAEAVVARIQAAGGTARAVCFDLADFAATDQAIAELMDDDHPIQVLVNNAGIHDDAPLAGMSAERWHRVVDISLNGFYHVTHPLLLPMIRTRWGRIINISSIAGVMGNRGQVNYAAAKAGLIGATKALAQECATRGVLVNAIAPGIIESPMIESAFTPEQIRQLVPMARAGKPEEVADLVAFLASDRAAYITGQVIGINGGMA
ncbi:3-oxoacyl-ACP reductase FabG [Halothiobacillus sp.]|uniref:3-oxoacyl-ACP reductase FabG n=1 Tax=Halothiobacillus sp. TaxID=1891311 RepID=UPI0026031A2B|nr:3-oxoacyl-ACP reductase FabG [Halothiobacillus sp.]MDD4967403.1 3-oxoacyl-ACP reductase FabG [Halothiobacillus sp.]